MLTSHSKSPFYKTRAATAKKSNHKHAFFVTENATPIDGGTTIANLPNTVTANTNELESLFFVTQELEAEPHDTESNSGDKLDVARENEDDVIKEFIRPNFLNEPYKAEEIILSDDSVNSLSGDNWLSTELLDFLIKNSTPHWLPSDVAIPTSDVERVLDELNTKTLSNNPDDLEFVKNKRTEYKYFAKKNFRIYTFSLQKGHYFLLDMIFHGGDTDGDFFQYITVYDNLLRRERNNKKANTQKKKLRNEYALQLLKKYQTFFYNYVLHEKEELLLLNYKEKIFNEVTYVESPVLENPYDCGLYAFAILLHCLRTIPIQPNVFTQDNITAFRNGLRIVLNGPVDELQADPRYIIPVGFIYSFFGLTYQESNKPNYFLQYLHKVTNYLSPIKPRKENSEEPVSEAEVGNKIVENTSDGASGSGAVVPTSECTHDYLFTEMFVYGNDADGNPCNFDEFTDLDDLSKKIIKYEVASDLKLRINKSNSKVGSRLYTCVSHKNCGFRARFGPRRGDKKLVLKRHNLYHSGIDRHGKYDNGKNFKQQLSATIGITVDKIEEVKHSKAVANDVVKAARVLQGNNASYNQGHQVISKKNLLNKYESKKSYELIIPYLEEFKRKNPGTVAVYELVNNSSINKLFLCPGIMNNKLRFARPVMALDATHLSSDSKGTLYLACVKSGNDELLPIAIGITEDNENYAGWKYFLYHLKKACGHLVDDHYLPQCRPYKLWSFVSDRDKGLLPALRDIYPENHQTNCLQHIRQNVVKEGGVKAGDLAFAMGKTFSSREEEKILNQLRRKNVKLEEYVLNIDPKTWRNTEWIRNSNLPPRYGMVTSNICESANFMFKPERSLNWLKSLDGIIHKIMFKIANHRRNYSDKKGMIKFYQNEYKKLYESCSKYNIIPINEEQHTYKVYLGEGDDYQHNKSHELNIKNKTCSCGRWQDMDLMCEHLLSYYRNIEKKTLKQILEMPINPYYSYQYLRSFYKENINPVVIDALSSDNKTQPPPKIINDKLGVLATNDDKKENDRIKQLLVVIVQKPVTTKQAVMKL